MPRSIQRSFAGGEIAPSLYGRADQAKYQTGAKTVLNYMVQRYGGVQNRTGGQFIAEVKDSADEARLVPFVFDEDNSYVVEFGDLYCRFIKVGAQLGGPYEIVSPYAHTDLAELKFVQLGDVMTICHKDYPPYELKRFGDVSWTLTAKSFQPEIAFPRNMALSSITAGTNTYYYCATAISAATGEESLISNEGTTGGVISAATQASECAITCSNATPTLQDGDVILIEGITGMTELNDHRFSIYDVQVAGTTTFKLTGIDSTNFTAYSSGGTIQIIGSVATSAAVPTAGDPHIIQFDDVPGAAYYNVYRRSSKSDPWGLIGTAEQVTPAVGTVQFNDTGFTPDTAFQPPVYAEPFRFPGDYPSVPAYHQQRLFLASTTNNPETVWASRVGRFNDFSISSPLQDDDALEFIMAGGTINEVRHMLDLGVLVVLTSGGEWTVDAGGAALAPTTVQAKQQTYHGSSNVAPVIIGNNALFVQARGRIVRDLRFQFESDGYNGQDLTIYAHHLFRGKDLTVKSWAFQQAPQAVLWTVQDSGDLRGLTYIPEHQLWGWHRHETRTGEKFLDVVSVPESQTVEQDDDTIREDFIYYLVERTVDGNTVKYIERLPSRERANELRHMKFLDSHLTYDGENLTNAGYDDSATATLTGSGWTPEDTLTLTMSAATFSGTAADVDNGMWLTDPADDTVRIFVRITAHNSTTVCSVKPTSDVPAGLQATATTVWSYAVDQVSGLDHLEDEEVWILAEGFVETPLTVASGSITLPRAYSLIHVGLHYLADLETLDAESTQQETLIPRKKRINEITLLVEDTRGLWAGPDEDNLREFKQRDTEDYTEPIALETGPVSLTVRGKWRDHSRTLVRQVDPLPATILAIVPTGFVGE